ncbi:MAG TPA: bile acid:sodium symporter family protein [Verrucomicrobiales bacterium]|nr:bile acid:sodium symporter family protein [Verrucomicrobiales bacterium]
MHRFLTSLTNLFALWILLGTAWALIFPAWFTWFQPWIAPGLGLIMLGMGLTLRFADFAEILSRPTGVAAGVAGQFLIMPAAGYLLARVFGLPEALSLGLILVACCPGGTASNVIAYLGRASVPLSVIMTLCSTLLSVVLTPWLTQLLARRYMSIDPAPLMLTMIQIVLLPVLAGIVLNQYLPNFTGRIQPAAPLVSVFTIVLIVGCIVGQQRDLLRESAGPLLLAVFLLHSFGFGAGYIFALALGQSETYRRTISVEVGMQNSGLGSALAARHFTDPITAVPAALSAVTHCLIGSALAGLWRLRPAPLEARRPQ